MQSETIREKQMQKYLAGTVLVIGMLVLLPSFSLANDTITAASSAASVSKKFSAPLLK